MCFVFTLPCVQVVSVLLSPQWSVTWCLHLFCALFIAFILCLLAKGHSLIYVSESLFPLFLFLHFNHLFLDYVGFLCDLTHYSLNMEYTVPMLIFRYYITSINNFTVYSALLHELQSIRKHVHWSSDITVAEFWQPKMPDHFLTLLLDDLLAKNMLGKEAINKNHR